MDVCLSSIIGESFSLNYQMCLYCLYSLIILFYIVYLRFFYDNTYAGVCYDVLKRRNGGDANTIACSKITCSNSSQGIDVFKDLTGVLDHLTIKWVHESNGSLCVVGHIAH